MVRGREGTLGSVAMWGRSLALRTTAVFSTRGAAVPVWTDVWLWKTLSCDDCAVGSGAAASTTTSCLARRGGSGGLRAGNATSLLLLQSRGWVAWSGALCDEWTCCWWRRLRLSRSPSCGGGCAPASGAAANAPVRRASTACALQPATRPAPGATTACSWRF